MDVEVFARVPGVLTKVEERLSGPWLVGQGVTWADLYLYHYLTSWATAIPNLLESLPR